MKLLGVTVLKSNGLFVPGEHYRLDIELRFDTERREISITENQLGEIIGKLRAMSDVDMEDVEVVIMEALL